LLENYDGSGHVNIGTGSDLTIRELADLIAQTVGYDGTTYWDETKPDGTPQKLLDVSLLNELGWSPKISLESGVKELFEVYKSMTIPFSE
jgi:GDP-L-fucose synthase